MFIESCQHSVRYFLSRVFFTIPREYKNIRHIPSFLPQFQKSVPLKFHEFWGGALPSREILERTNQDAEKLFYQNRFSWLMNLDLNSQSEKQKQIELILKWIDRAQADPQYACMDSYSCSQRLVHWIYLMAYAEDNLEDEIAASIRNSLHAQVKILIKNLEMRGLATNNHLSNNGRALYLAGIYLQNIEAVTKGREILQIEKDRLFSRRGFLREGSSHYQIIVTLRFLESWYWARELNDEILEKDLREVVGKAVSASLFFLKGAPPLVGDVCPDLFPEETPDLRKISLFLFDAPFVEKSLENSTCGLDDGYVRLDRESAACYARLSPDGARTAYSHGHADDLSFVLFVRGLPLVVDSGRISYDESGSRYRDVFSHASVLLDGKSVTHVHKLNGIPDLFPKYFKIKNQMESLSVHSVFMKCFAYRFFRQLYLEENFLKIVDEWNGKGDHDIECYFPLHPDVVAQLEGQKIKIAFGDIQGFLETSGNGKWSLYRGEGLPQRKGWYSPRYGEETPATLICYSERVALPMKRDFILSWDKKCAA